MNNISLQRKIMRRVYYAYMLRTAFQPVVVHGFVMLGLLIMLTYFVSIGNVINNLLLVKVHNLDTFFYNAITNTEAWTLVILGGLIFSAFSLRFTIAPRSQALRLASLES